MAVPSGHVVGRYDPAVDAVQPIMVPRSGTHLATMHAVAAASLAAYLRPRQGELRSPAWASWLAHAPAKTVRRVKAASHLGQVEQWAREQGADHAVVTLAEGNVIALGPMAYADFPRRVAGAQVHGVDYPREDAGRAGAPGPVVVSVMRDLSTGKAAAQAAHALWHWALPRVPHLQHPCGLDGWLRSGMRFEVELVAAGELVGLAGLPGALEVHDAGRTEVAPDTLTAVAVPSP